METVNRIVTEQSRMQQITSTVYGAGTGSRSVIKNTKNEPVVGKNTFQEHDHVKEHS